ncbi:Na(+)/H(+) antiporter subunit B [bacterium]|nr:Na(+)/H(+) antiporter subunit B [bacterium]
MKINSIILNSTARLLVFFINVFAIYLMFRGHNFPGGGFIAGLVSAISIVLLSMTLGLDEVKQIIRVDPVLIAVVGLILAYGTSLAPTVLGMPFLKHEFIHLHHIPLFGEVHIGTPFLFDLGVYLVVIGVTCKILMTFSYLIYEKEEYFLEETFLYAARKDAPINELDGDENT